MKIENLKIKICTVKVIFHASILVALLLFIYWETFIWMFERWTTRDSYYTHGFLIPLLSGYLIWKKRTIFDETKMAYSSLGKWFLLLGIILQLVSVFWKIHFSSAISLLFILLGISYTFFGSVISKYLLFPILYLFFMIPLPLVAIAEFSLRLKLFAATVGLKIAEYMGVIAVQQGAIIHFTDGHMVVGDVCSGLRSIIALLAFGAFYAYIIQFSLYKKIVLFLLSFPIAILANVTRIVLLCIIAEVWGVDAVHGVVHDWSGILIFVFA
ncbi:exosortase/archaeosortase family protein, partial [Chlamydiota bacterium]